MYKIPKFKLFIVFSRKKSAPPQFPDANMIRLQRTHLATKHKKLAHQILPHQQRIINFLKTERKEQTLQEACKHEIISSNLTLNELITTQTQLASHNPPLAFQAHTQFDKFTTTLKNLGTAKHLTPYIGAPLDEMKKIGTVCRQENFTNTNNINIIGIENVKFEKPNAVAKFNRKSGRISLNTGENQWWCVMNTPVVLYFPGHFCYIMAVFERKP